MNCLGIESTAHTLGIGISTPEEIIANEKDAYKPEEGKGIIPREAAEHHNKVKEKVLERALKKAGINKNEIDLIAIANGPGLPPCLLEGLNLAKKLSKELNVKIVPVNHCIGHIEIGKKETGAKNPLVQYVSGGNTQILSYSEGRYRIYGETHDIGIGNAFDKFARSLNLKMPGGPKIMKLAERGEEYVKLPYTVKGMDLSFSGLVTEASKKKEEVNKEDLAYSFQETILSMLVEVTERALAHTEKKELLLTGGVALNTRLREMNEKMTREHDASFHVPKNEYCGDNGAMIAYTGIKFKEKAKKEVDINPRWRTNQYVIKGKKQK
ncbi:MAG: KEOPS complex N(6)-L-threonylcarbamoyladenine synthase Kae1 [archaeon]